MKESEKRDYKSPLREQQSERTREIIVEAIAAQIVEHGLSDFSVNEIAKRAGVSVRTVYRYFPTREDLFQAAEEDWKKRAPQIPPPQDLDALPATIDPVFRYFERNKDVMEAALVTSLGKQVHDRMKKQRNEWSMKLAREAAPNLSEDELKARSAVFRVVGGSAMWRFLTRDAGLSVDEAIAAAQWAIAALSKELVADNARAKRRRKDDE